MRMPYMIVVGCLLALSGCQAVDRVGTQAATADAEAHAWYEDEIRAFEAADRAAPPEPGHILFIGSSSIRMWSSLEDDMAPWPVLNRGFGGSKTGDVLEVMHRIVFPYKPSAIAYYCGDNDLGETNTDDASAAEGFIEFSTRVHRRFPDTPIIYLAIKPSPARWDNWPSMRRANQRVASYAANTDHVLFADVATCLLGPDGRPRRALYIEDGLHLSRLGYAEWVPIVREQIRAAIEQDATPAE